VFGVCVCVCVCEYVTVCLRAFLGGGASCGVCAVIHLSCVFVCVCSCMCLC